MALEKQVRTEQVAEGIFTIETHYLQRQRFACCYLVLDGGEAAIIETNTNHAVPLILAAVDRLALKREQVKYVILTHIHLDHAGGTGDLMRHLPAARVVLHPRGRRHMVDPEKLIESVKLVYGEEKYREMYGDILPVEKALIETAQHGQVIHVGERELLLYEAPGHAKHHIIVFDQKTKSLFSGDAFGIAYPRFAADGRRLVFPPTAPTQFDPDASLETFQKIVDLKPGRVLHTHFGKNEQVEESHQQLRRWVEFSAAVAKRRYHQGYRHEALDTILREDVWARFEQEVKQVLGAPLSEEEREFLFLDADINAKGLAFYIQKLHSKEES